MLRLTEIYTSVQGEGPRTGYLTTFVRFAGCNMRCPGWPCDTEYSIEPKLYLSEGGSFRITSGDLMGKILDMKGPPRLCLTGGEPFVQPHADLQEFTDKAIKHGYSIECFTNGSFEIPKWAMQTMTFVMDWKLPGSGEERTKLKERYNNALALRRADSLKFVVVDMEDVHVAITTSQTLLEEGFEGQFWVAPVWGKLDPALLSEILIEKNLPWRLNLQMHKYIWPEAERGV